MELRSVGYSDEQPTATMAARQPTGLSYRSAAKVADSPAAKSTKVGARRPISETWTKARPHAESSKENVGRKENNVSGNASRSPFQERRFCSPATETGKVKRVGDVNTSVSSKCSRSSEGDTKRPVGAIAQPESREKLRRRIDMTAVGPSNANPRTCSRRSPDVNISRKSTSSPSSDDTGSRKPTISSLFSKLGNLGDKIHLIQSQKVDLEARYCNMYPLLFCKHDA